MTWFLVYILVHCLNFQPKFLRSGEHLSNIWGRRGVSLGTNHIRLYSAVFCFHSLGFLLSSLCRKPPLPSLDSMESFWPFVETLVTIWINMHMGDFLWVGSLLYYILLYVCIQFFNKSILFLQVYMFQITKSNVANTKNNVLLLKVRLLLLPL